MNKKIAVLLFHSNICKIYKLEWIEQCISSIKKQTIQNFNVYELCYDDKDINCLSKNNFKSYKYYNISLFNHVFAENIIINIAYNDGADYFYIVNLDDYYSPNRIEMQLKALNSGYDLVSSDFKRFGEYEKEFKMSKLNFAEEAKNNHNIIAHPVVAFNRNFWEKCRFFDINGIPEEDFTMWKNAQKKGMKFYIVPEILLYHRVHQSNISK